MAELIIDASDKVAPDAELIGKHFTRERNREHAAQ
jgi:hypothetical protein